VCSRIRQVLRLDAGAVLEAGQRLLDLGLDSLMALELRRLLAVGLAVAEDALSATLVFDYPTIGAIVEHLAHQLNADAGRAAVSLPAPPTVDHTAGAATALRVDDVAAMSDAEVEALLLAKLNRQG
jgi:acyl carrier protein